MREGGGENQDEDGELMVEDGRLNAELEVMDKRGCRFVPVFAGLAINEFPVSGSKCKVDSRSVKAGQNNRPKVRDGSRKLAMVR